MQHRIEITPGVESEFEPGSHGRVLRNLAGIKTKSKMDAYELRYLLEARKRSLELVTPRTQFTVDFLLQMHRDWLGKLYAWAGRYRTIELAKAEFRWPPATLIPMHMSNFEVKCLKRHTPCAGTLAEVVRAMAEVHAELLLIHPFREGNGRLARWLADLMALQAGQPLPDYAFRGAGSKRNRMQYLAAVGQGYLLNYGFLADFFRESIERGRT